MVRKSQRDRVWSYIARRPVSGATRKEIEYTLGMLHQSVGPRVRELLDADLVRETSDVRDGSRVLVARKRGRR
jgi:hypothetical protein